MKKLVFFTATAFMLAACASDKSIDKKAMIELPPMPKPATIAPEQHVLNKGSPAFYKVVGQDGEWLTWRVVEGRDPGCEWADDGWFSPSPAWKNCGRDTTGTQAIEKSGNIWPLAVGKSESYKVEGQDTKDTWHTTRTCEVTGTAMVTIAQSQYPTYEVVCQDSWNRRTWYVSPELKTWVKYKKVNKRRGLEDDMVMVM